MARIKQLYLDNYRTSSEISDEFRNLVTYLNGAEVGNETLAELMSKLFDDDGQLKGLIELRLDTENGLQYRVGNDATWTTVVQLSDIRGPSGVDVGTLSEPIFKEPFFPDILDGQTELDFIHNEGDIVLVYKNGLLLSPDDDYTTSYINDTVTLLTPLITSDTIGLELLRSSQLNGFSRVDFDTLSTQSAFPVEFSEADRLMVYLNGQFQREGAAYDYIASPATSQLTTTSPIPAGQRLTVLKISNTIQQVGGLMMQDRYCSLETGLILQNNIEFTDDGLPAEKVTGLAPFLADGLTLEVGASEPSPPDERTIWLDTSGVSAQLKYYDGLSYVIPSSETSLPSFTESNSGQVLLVHPTGTRLQWGDLDLSGFIQTNSKGASNGVASLDSLGRLPESQLPVQIARQSVQYDFEDGVGIVDGTYPINRFLKQKVSIDGIYLFPTGGTADVSLTVNDVVQPGTTYSVSTVGATEDTLTSPIEVDAYTSSKAIGIKVENAASFQGLTVVVSFAVVTN